MLLNRELFVDTTRSVSVVLGEKDNKSVGAYLFEIFSLHDYHLLPGFEEEDKGSSARGAAKQEEEPAQGEERRQGR